MVARFFFNNRRHQDCNLGATAIIGDIGFKVESLTTGINLKDADGTITIAQHERNRRIEFIVIE